MVSRVGGCSRWALCTALPGCPWWIQTHKGQSQQSWERPSALSDTTASFASWGGRRVVPSREGRKPQKCVSQLSRELHGILRNIWSNKETWPPPWGEANIFCIEMPPGNSACACLSFECTRWCTGALGGLGKSPLEEPLTLESLTWV